MNKSVIISIQPYWVFLIIAKAMGWDIPQGKTVEVRKDYPKDKLWNKLTHIYCSKNRKSFNRIPKQYQPFMKKLLGKVIGEFVCDRIEKFVVGSLACDDVEQKACISYREICDYFYGKNYDNTVRIGYAWHISRLKIYDTPNELRDFFRPCPFQNGDNYIGDCLHCDFLADNDYGGVCTNVVTRPPQSWCYAEGLC